MRTAIATALLAGSCFATSGCALGTISRFDGDWPIAPPPKESEPQFTDVGSGQGGALLLERGSSSRYRIAEPGREATFELSGEAASLDGAVLDGDSLYLATGAGVVRRRCSGSTLEAPETVLALDGVRLFAVAPGKLPGELVVAAATERAVFVALPGNEPRLVFEGHALGLALDAEHGALWVASDRPLAVLDSVRLADGATLLRTPLPRTLTSPLLRVVASGEACVAYSLERPIEEGLLVSRRTKEALPLLRLWNADEAHRGRTVEDSEPPVALPPGHETPAGFELAGAWQRPGRGRVVAFPGERFLLVDGRNGAASVAVIVPPSTRGSPPSLRVIPTPSNWPGVVQGLGSTATGAVLTAGSKRIELAPDTLDDAHGTGEGLSARRFFNFAINGVIATGEVAVSLPLGELRGALVCPIGLIGCVVYPCGTTFMLATAPLWSPFAHEL